MTTNTLEERTQTAERQALQVKPTPAKKYDPKTKTYYTFNILTTLDYKKATWNGTGYDNDGAGIKFTISNAKLKELDFNENIYFARFYTDNLINDGLCHEYELLARNKVSGKISVAYTHHSTPKVTPEMTNEILAFNANSIL